MVDRSSFLFCIMSIQFQYDWYKARLSPRTKIPTVRLCPGSKNMHNHNQQNHSLSIELISMLIKYRRDHHTVIWCSFRFERIMKKKKVESMLVYVSLGFSDQAWVDQKRHCIASLRISLSFQVVVVKEKQFFFSRIDRFWIQLSNPESSTYSIDSFSWYSERYRLKGVSVEFFP